MTQKKWKNRIVRSGEVDPKTLVPNPDNWRKHPKYQEQTMAGILDDIGWIQDVIVNEHTGHLIDGHLRVEIALKNKEPLVPVKYVDLTEEEERKALVTFDPIAAMIETDKELLEQLIEQCETENDDVKGLLQDIAEKEGLDVNTFFDIPEIVNDVESVTTKDGQYDKTKLPIQVGALLVFVSKDEQSALSDGGFDVFYRDDVINREDVKTLLKQYIARLGDEIRSTL